MICRIGALGEVQTTFAPFGQNTSPMPPKARVARAEAVASAARVTPATSFASAKGLPPAAVAAAPVVGCGPEPARTKAGAGGTSRYDDPAAGARWQACIAGEERAKEKAFYDRVLAGQAGGSDGCGDVSAVRDTGSPYTGAALRDAWAACRARVLPPAPAVAAPVVVQAELVQSIPSRASGGGGYEAPAPSSPILPALEKGSAPPIEAQGLSAGDTPLALYAAVGAVVVIGGGIGIYYATRGPKKKRRRSFSVAP